MVVRESAIERQTQGLSELPFEAEALPLYELYTRLQEAGLPLGLNEYAQLLKALQAGFGVSDRSALARLCMSLWVKNEEEAYIFNYHFAAVMGDQQQSFAQVAELNARRSCLAQDAAYAQKLTVQLTRTAMRSILVTSGLFLAALVIFNLMQPKLQSEPEVPPSDPVPPQIDPQPELPSPAPPFVPQEGVRKVSVVLLSALVGAMLVGTGVSWLFIRQFTVVQAASSTDDDENTFSRQVTVSQAGMTDVGGDEVQLAETLRAEKAESKRPGIKVLGQDEYFPLTRRQMKQGWRYLRRRSREGPKTEFDLDGTVRHIAHQGSFFKPVMRASRNNRTDLVFLLDQEGSMVPFASLSKRLVTTATRSGRLGNASTYYFHNCPSRYVYYDSLMQQPEPLDRLLAGRLTTKSVVVIVSDAGAARGGLNAARIEKTKALVAQLNQCARYVVWLNPLPKARWENTTAGHISNFIAMFEVNRTGFQSAIDVLRGRWKPDMTVPNMTNLTVTNAKTEP